MCMPKPSFIELTVKNPCQENWDGMSDANDGRFCNGCQKTVIDFTSWSDAALYRFFIDKNEKVCGRFLATQLNTPLHIPHQPYSRLYRMTIALGLTLIFTQTPTALAQNKPPKIASVLIVDNKRRENISYAQIYGKIQDQYQRPVIKVVVQAYQNGKLKRQTTTNDDGDFDMRFLEAGSYDLILSGIRYDSTTINNVVVGIDERVQKDLVMHSKTSANGNPIFVFMGKALVSADWKSRKSAEIFGRIRNREGELLEGAQIKIYKKGKLKKEQACNSNGEYSIARLNPGMYDIQITIAGYKDLEYKNIWLRAGENLHNIIIGQ